MILQNDLIKQADWEQLGGMEFHPQKCSYLKISRSRKPKTYKYILKGVTLAEETSTKYLGVDIQSNLAWNNHIDLVTKNSNNMLGFLRRNLRSASPETKTRVYYDGKVQPRILCLSMESSSEKIRAENRNGPTQSCPFHTQQILQHQ